MAERYSFTFGEVTRNHDSIRVPVRSADRRPGPFPYYGASGIVDHVSDFLFDGEYLLVAEDGENLRTRKTPIAFMASGKFWVNNHAHVVQGNDLANTRFLCYLLAETDISGYLSGSTQPKLTQNALHSIKVRLPSRRTQDDIIEVLGALDDKIAANERIIETSDQLIRNHFEAAVVGPDSRKVPLPTAVHITFGAPFSSSCFNSSRNGLPLIRIRDLKTFTPQVWTDERLPRGLLVNPGETVAGMDAEFRPSFWLGEPGLLNQRVLHAMSRVGGGYALAREALRAPLAEVENYKTGTTVAHLNKKDLESLEVLIPGESQIQAFELPAEALRREITSISAQSRTLAALRDTLLPQLMSGRLRVRDAERIVEDAV